jgi:hypothetical protein
MHQQINESVGFLTKPIFQNSFCFFVTTQSIDMVFSSYRQHNILCSDDFLNGCFRQKSIFLIET